MKDKRCKWTKVGDSYQAWLGNAMRAVVRPEVRREYKRLHHPPYQSAGRDVRYWRSSVEANGEPVRREFGVAWKTLAEAKAYALTEAYAVGNSMVRILREELGYNPDKPTIPGVENL
jgi:hypothetical protein